MEENVGQCLQVRRLATRTGELRTRRGVRGEGAQRGQDCLCQNDEWRTSVCPYPMVWPGHPLPSASPENRPQIGTSLVAEPMCPGLQGVLPYPLLCHYHCPVNVRPAQIPLHTHTGIHTYFLASPYSSVGILNCSWSSIGPGTCFSQTLSKTCFAQGKRKSSHSLSHYGAVRVNWVTTKKKKLSVQGLSTLLFGSTNRGALSHNQYMSRLTPQ